MKPILILVALISSIAGAAASETELDAFFPSVPIHEDDRLDGHYTIEITGCHVVVTETTRQYVSVSHADLRYFETDPGRLAWPYGNRLSTRYLVAWNAHEVAQKENLNTLQHDLRELRISWRDRKTLGADALILKSEALKAKLLEIRNGVFGEAAQNNHTERYLLHDETPVLVSVTLNISLQLPVQVKDMSELAHAMYRHNLNCG